MPILDAVLAFAITIFIVATIVSQLVSIMRNGTKIRNRHLKEMLTEYFDNELQPVIERELHRVRGKINLSSSAEKNLKDALAKFNQSTLFNPDELEKLIEVSTEELTEHLKRSELGKQLLIELSDESQIVFDELGKRYEKIGDKFTASFRAHRKIWATGVAFVFALVLNIDSIHIANTYLNNSSMREGAISQMNKILTTYKADVETLEKKQTAGDEGSDQSVLAQKAIKKAISQSKEQIDILTQSGFPVGWTYFPHVYLKDETSKEYKQRNTATGWFVWCVGIIFTAFLAGLGSPFWYDVVTGVSRIAQRTRTSKKK